jgi:hypothetical protein
MPELPFACCKTGLEPLGMQVQLDVVAAFPPPGHTQQALQGLTVLLKQQVFLHFEEDRDRHAELFGDAAHPFRGLRNVLPDIAGAVAEDLVIDRQD